MRPWLTGALVFLLRLATVSVLALIVTLATSLLQDRLLPAQETIGQAFDRLGWAIQAGVATGTIIGVIATHRVGHRTLSLGPRVLHGAILAIPMLYLWLMWLFD